MTKPTQPEKVLLDTCVSGGVRKPLRDAGHDVIFAMASCLGFAGLAFRLDRQRS